MIERPSPNFEPRRAGSAVDMLVLHYTGMTSAAAALGRLCDPAAKVGAHYLIDEDGTIYRLVAEDMRAWHAGASSWRGATDVNGRSIGIELVNPGHEFGYRAFPEAQMAALEGLAGQILSRHPIPARHVLGHSDVAPGRKTDPGELFDWPRLARAGIGMWPEESAGRAAATGGEAHAMLKRFGYGIGEPEAGPVDVIAAFQRHFRRESVTGIVDDETLNRLALLVELIG